MKLEANKMVKSDPKMSQLEVLSATKTCGGYLCRIKIHQTHSLGGLDSIFGIFFPPSVGEKAVEILKSSASQLERDALMQALPRVSTLLWLSGLTCTDENFSTKGTVFSATSTPSSAPSNSPFDASSLGFTPSSRCVPSSCQTRLDHCLS
eukprot:Sdes_comp20489_c0_seq4m14900